MKKIVRQQNYLKDLIESQENQFLSKQALKSVMRAVLEPVLDTPEEGVILHRIYDKTGILGLIKRLEFSVLDVYDFSDESGLLKEKVWANTEFLCVMTHRFVAIFVWDNKTDNQNYVRYYSVYNSRIQHEVLDIIGRNTDINVKEFQEKFKPDRRDNLLLNSSIRRLIENMDSASKDALLGFAQIQSEKESEEVSQNIRQIAHEIRNQLSICDLYSEIAKKSCMKNGIKDEKILNALNCVNRAVRIAGNCLLELKTSDKPAIKQHSLKELINTTVDLTKVYFECKNIEYIVENNLDIKIPVDANKFVAGLINIIKNGVEAFNNIENSEEKSNGLEMVSDTKKVSESSIKNSPFVKLVTEEGEDFAIIRISNNAGKIEDSKKIFDEGYTTKKDGHGLGLIICKKNIEEMFGELKLEHTGDDYTEFLVKIAKI